MRNGMLCLMIALVSSAACAAPRTWELREGGRWQEVDKPTTQAVREPTLDQAERHLAADEISRAKDLLVPWIKANPASPVRDRAIFLLGEANFRKGDRVQAFYNFDELLDRYVASPYFNRALQRQYDIADAYLSGFKNKFLGIRILSGVDEAIEMLYRVQQRAPGSPAAEKALLRTADYYYENGDSELASDAYAAYVRSYPRSPNVPKVRLRQAFSALRQFRGTKFDATPVIDARQQLVDLAAAYPELAEKENVKALLERIDASLAAKMIETAAFYRRTGQPKAAAYYYRYIMRTFPVAPEAARAKAELASLAPEHRAETPRPPASRPANP